MHNYELFLQVMILSRDSGGKIVMAQEANEPPRTPEVTVGPLGYLKISYAGFEFCGNHRLTRTRGYLCPLLRAVSAI